jgi:hypothetical protein
MQILGRSKVHMPRNEGADIDADVELARKKVLVAQIERKGRMQAILDYVGLTVRIMVSLEGGCWKSLNRGTRWQPTLLP